MLSFLIELEGAVKIIRVAYFRACPECGKHGRIVLANGQTGSEASCKEQARESLKGFRKLGVLSDDEAKIVADQIESSFVPEMNSLLTQALVELVNDAQVARLSQEEEASFEIYRDPRRDPRPN